MADLQLIATGADWSARPIFGHALTRSLNRANGQTFAVDLVLRYANFAGQGLSYLDKAEYESHLAAGKRSYLIFQKGTADPAGGAAGGRAFGAEAVAYARKIGYRAGDPIFFTADGWAATKGYAVGTAMQFFAEATRVVRESGFLGGVYGFADVILTAIAQGIGDVYWLCGDRAGLRKQDGSAQGIHLYQWNNGRVWIESAPGVWVECDLVEQYEPIGTGKDDDDMGARELAILENLEAWLLKGGPDTDKAHANGELPEGLGATSVVATVYDTNKALRAVWEETGRTVGQVLQDLVHRPDVKIGPDEARAIAEHLAAAGLPDVFIDKLGELFTKDA